MKRPASTAAFTLMELLVVISIISLLIALLLPSLNGARESGRSVVCMNNVRQIGYGIQLYGEDYEAYPWAQETDPITGAPAAWHVKLAPILEKVNYSYANKGDGQTFVMSCPTALAAGLGTPGLWQYSVNPQLFGVDSVMQPNSASCTCVYPRIFPYAERPTEVILLADGSLFWDGESSHAFFGVGLPAGGSGNTWAHKYNVDDPAAGVADPGDNTDTLDNWQHIRWRHGGNQRANILFLDYHVEALHKTALRYKHFQLSDGCFLP